MSNLAIDVGNTQVKWGLFEQDELISSGIEIDALDFENIEKVIVSSVREKLPFELPSVKTLIFSHQTRLPIVLAYDTPETLGLDRIAGAVGAFVEFPDQPCLLIDAGTCITYDLISGSQVFNGGAIAPGLQMRVSSMHHYTDKLPKVVIVPTEKVVYPGKSTVESMKVGAVDGIIFEMEGYISRLKKEFPLLHVILSGGDASYFESKIKAPIFVRPEIILKGLNRILLHNEMHA